MPSNENENLTVKDMVVLSAFATCTVIAVGALAQVGRNAVDEFIERREVKKRLKSQA